MPQITCNLRLLFSPNPSFLFSSFKPYPFLKSTTKSPFFTLQSSSSSSSSKPQRYNSKSYNPNRRISTGNPNSINQSNNKEKQPLLTKMEDEVVETTKIGISSGFNKKRAEGRDKSSRPKDLKLKVRRLNPVNTISYVQVLGTGMDTQDTSPSVLLFFDKQRFIFNAGEGLQRFCTEHKIKLSKIDHIFLSRVCSETAGGLPGLLLTLAGTGEEGISVNVWGPSDFKYLVDAMKSFIPNAAMVHSRCFGSLTKSDNENPQKVNNQLKLIDDEVVKISAILLRPNCSKEDEFLLKSSDVSVLYICELPEIRGKFDLEKARALGLRPGPKYRELQEGISVKSDTKNIMVHPDDVLGPSVPGPVVLLVDCPTLSHFQELLSANSLDIYYSDIPNENRKVVNCVIHLSPASVVNSSDYQNWMSRFGGAEHIIAGHQMKNIEIPILQSSARVAARLNYLCPQFFPAPGFWSLQQPKLSTSPLANEGTDSKLCETISAENLLKFHLRPYAQLGLDRSNIPATSSPKEIIDDLISEIPEIPDAAQQIARLWQEEEDEGAGVISSEVDKNLTEEPWLNQDVVPGCLENITRENVEIVLLGTGSSQPSKYRNVSSVFINLFDKGSVLLDCGEGTLGQLKRRFGIQGADEVVKNLKFIWISHIHADHHTGLARILALRRDLLNKQPHDPIIVIGPRQLKRFLEAYEKLEDLNMQFLDCRHTTESSLSSFESSSNNASNGNKLLDSSNLFVKGSQMKSQWKRPGSPVDFNVVIPVIERLKDVLGNAGLESVVSVPVVHCPQSFGVVLTGLESVGGDGEIVPGWKIVYSGDTRPCPELIEASRGATVLIHEATFEDALVEEAIARNHSTTEEAIEVGNSAGVYRIILTHFSQRYPKIPVFDENYMHNTCIAFDMMSINFADLHVLPRVLPYLKLLFKNEMIVDECEDVENVVTIAA